MIAGFAAVLAGTVCAQDGERSILEGDGVLRVARMLPGETAFECVMPGEFSLAGLRLGDGIAALDPLGPPLALTSGYGEDDGGGYTGYAYRYDGLAVDVVRGEVDVVTALAPRWPTPSGLRVGMHRADVFAALGREPGPDYAVDDGYAFPGCPSPDGRYWDWMYFQLTFGADDRLDAIAIVADRP